MLKRIQKIQNIGRFSDCSPAGCEFAKETIVFALNTFGKSTLTAILRSIQTGNNEILIGRKTFGATGAKKIEVDFEENNIDEKYVFQNKAWNKHNPNILIFDSKFISENIFDGENITFEHQKNLNKVIIGKQGQDLNNDIAVLQKKSDDFENQSREKTAEFSRHFPGFDLDKFKKIKQDSSIDLKISGKEKEIKFEKEKTEISRLIAAHLRSVSAINFSIKETLEKTLDVKQEEIEKHIKSHFANEKNARNFLDDGLSFLKELPADGTKRVCVFCGQVLGEDAENLIGIYSTFFKGGYEQLQAEIIEATDYFKKINLENLLTKLATDLKSKDLDVGLTEAAIKEQVEAKINFESELEKKRDLNYKMDFKDFEHLKTKILEIKEELEKIQQEKINVVPAKSLTILEAEKEQLEIAKKRFDPAWVTFCQDLKTLEIEAKNLRGERETKRKELETYSTSIFNLHKETVNRFCADMCADFEIEDFKPIRKIVGKAERIFAIKFFGSHKVTIDGDDEKSPNFKNTLSESDKRLLAFAFFLSMLAQDAELDKKIVVFDDPMSSFDSERLRKTAELIADISHKSTGADGQEKIICPGQKIMLTHEDRFAKHLVRLMPNAQTLKVAEYTDEGNKRSKIVHADFYKDFPDDEITDKLQKIKSILENRQFAETFEIDCRIVLENIFKRKYYFEIENEIATRKSIRSFVVKLGELKINGFETEEKSKKFIRLCDDLNIELHDNGTQNSNGDRESILKDFFSGLQII